VSNAFDDFGIAELGLGPSAARKACCSARRWRERRHVDLHLPRGSARRAALRMKRGVVQAVHEPWPQPVRRSRSVDSFSRGAAQARRVRVKEVVTSSALSPSAGNERNLGSDGSRGAVGALAAFQGGAR